MFFLIISIFLIISTILSHQQLELWKFSDALLKKYITIEKIKNLTLEEFKSVGINNDLAEKILNHLNNSEN